MTKQASAGSSRLRAGRRLEEVLNTEELLEIAGYLCDGKRDALRVYLHCISGGVDICFHFTHMYNFNLDNKI